MLTPHRGVPPSAAASRALEPSTTGAHETLRLEGRRAFGPEERAHDRQHRSEREQGLRVPLVDTGQPVPSRALSSSLPTDSN